MILQFCEFEPQKGLCVDSMEPAWDSPSLSAPPFHTLSLKINKYTLKNEKKKNSLVLKPILNIHRTLKNDL